MHDPTAQGPEFFKCDFCRRPWHETRPMVEGHKGSLICGDCLTVAFIEVVHTKGGTALPEHSTCTMCIEHRKDPLWQSPQFIENYICRRCIRQSAQTLSKDPEAGWSRPVIAGAAPVVDDPDDEDDDDGHEH